MDHNSIILKNKACVDIPKVSFHQLVKGEYFPCGSFGLLYILKTWNLENRKSSSISAAMQAITINMIN